MAYINASKNAGFNKNRVTKRKKPTGYINASASKEKNRGGLLGGLGYVGGRLGLGAAGVAEGVGDILAAGGDLLSGDTEMAKYRFKNNETAELTEKLDETYNPGMIMRGAGDVASGIGNSLTFMIPYAGPYLAAAGYTGMGISSAAEKTGDVGLKELGYGAASGALEFGLEALTGGAGKAAKNIGASITRKLGKEAAESTAKATAKLAGKSFGKSVLTETLKGMAGEAIEEMGSEIIDPQLQKLFHIDPNAKTSLRDVAYAGMIGALSGGLMTVGPAAINYKTSVSVGKDIRESGNTKDFLDYTRRVLDASTRTRERHAEKAVEARESKLPDDAGKLKKTVNYLGSVSKKWKSERAGKRVEDMAETVRKNLDTYEGYLQKADKSPKELEISDAVLGELRGNVFLLENATAIELYEDTVLELEDDDKQELVDEINEDAKRLGLKRSDYTVTDLNDNVDDILTTVAIKYMMPEKYGVNLFEESRAKRKAAEPAQEAAEAAQGAEAVQAEQQTTEAAKPVQGRYKGAGAVRIAGGKQVKELGLSDEQYIAYKGAEIMAPALGTEIEINESLERDGKTVNGYYDPKTNTLKININAVRGGKKIALYTLGHESTHYIKANAPEQFGRLADFVEAQLGEGWSTLTAEKRESLSKLNLLTGMSEEQIADLVREEVVADGMEMILTDGKVLEELAHKDRSLWQTVKNWIQNTIAKIKEYYGQLNQASKTAQTLRETLNTLEEVERLFTEGVREAGERAGEESGKRYSIDDTEADSADGTDGGRAEATDREILAMALEGAVQNEQEYKIVKEYRDTAGLLDVAESKKKEASKRARDLESQIRQLKNRIETEGDPDGWIRKAYDQAISDKREAERMRDEQDKILDSSARELLRLRAAKPLREIVQREQRRANAAEKREQKTKEQAEARVERAEKRFERKAEKVKSEYEQREKISSDTGEITLRVRTVRKILGQLNTMLYHPNRQKHVPEGLQGLTEAVLKSADPQDFRKNRGNIRTMAELAASIDRLEKKTARTAGEQETLDRMKSKYEHLEAETISTYKQAKALLTAFEQYQKDTLGEAGFDKETIENMAELVEQIKEVPMTEMTLESLKAVETFYTMILHQVNSANQTFATEKALNIDELGQKASQEARDAKALKVLSPKGREWVGMASVRKFFLQNMKPLTVFEAIGSNQFKELFQRVLDGENEWARFIESAREKIVTTRKKYGYDKWDLEERIEVKTKSGTVKLNRAEIMELYAGMRREQTLGHLEGGGFQLDKNATEATKVGELSPEILKKRVNDAKNYVMDQLLLAEMSELLTKEQRAYVEDMQQYLTDLGKEGNKVSQKLYGVNLFSEEHYFPITVAQTHLNVQTGRTGDPNIRNKGMTHELAPNAHEPIVIKGFDTAMVNHINDMATYCAFVLPLEDLTRVLNYKPVNYKRDADGNVILDKNGKPEVDDSQESTFEPLRGIIKEKYGNEMNEYIVQLIRDLNGGARRDAAAGIIDKGITQFKRASTMASLSVLIQQPTSIVRAAAYIDPKYLLNTEGLKLSPKKHKELWERVKKYAPVAIIKEMGGYDTGVGARTADHLNAATYEKGERLKGFLTDADYRAEVFGIGAAYADELAWVQMFEACVNEQADKLGKSRDSEDVLKAAGERFTEIVRHTQVYDSTLTRSESMRSKDTGAKMATAFMAEPTTVVSMIAEALIKGERGDKKFLRNTVGAVIGSILLNSLMSSLVYAMRDDDEDKTYGEKYVSTLAMEMAEGINPAEYFPVLRDIMSLVKGYEVERSDMALIGDLINSIRRMSSSNQSVVQKLTNTGGAVAAFFGLPVTNVMRDVNGLKYTFLHQTDTERYTGKGLSVAMMEEFDTVWGLFDEKTTNGYQLYQSALDHDAEHFARVAARYESEAAAEQALRKALREYDPRINEAAEARLSGELDVYEDVVSRIEAEGNFDRNMVIRAINNEMIYIKDHMEDETVPKAEDEDEDEEETAEALYKTSDLNAALERGDDKDYGDIYDYLMTSKQEGGKTEAQARSAVKSSITSYWKKRYLEAWEANDTGEIKRIQAILTGTKLYGSRNEVAKMGEGWVKAYAESLIKK